MKKILLLAAIALQITACDFYLKTGENDPSAPEEVPEAISVVPSNLTMRVDTFPIKQRFVAIGRYADGSTKDLTNKVFWTLSNNGLNIIDIAMISNEDESKGVMIVHDTGSVNITATLGEKSAATNFTIVSDTPEWIEINPSNASTAIGEKQQFTAIGTYSDGSRQDITTQVNWMSWDSGVATISNAAGCNGLATPVKEGNVNITATLGALSGNATYIVTPAIQKFTVTYSGNGNTGGQVPSTPVSYEYGSPVTVLGNTKNLLKTGYRFEGWYDQYGSFYEVGSILKIGKENLILYAKWTEFFKTIEITPDTVSTSIGEKQQFTAIGTYSDGSKQNITTQVNWMCSDSNIATISNEFGCNGLATPITSGNVKIIARLGSIWNEVELYVTQQIALEDARNVKNGVGYFRSLSGYHLLNDENKPLLNGIDFEYGRSLNSGLYDIFDTGTNGPFAGNTCMRIVLNGMNVSSGLGLIPIAKDLGIEQTPESNEVYIDPVRGKFILPRPTHYWNFNDSLPERYYNMKSNYIIQSNETAIVEDNSNLWGTRNEAPFLNNGVGLICGGDDLRRYRIKLLDKFPDKGTVSMWCGIFIDGGERWWWSDIIFGGESWNFHYGLAFRNATNDLRIFNGDSEIAGDGTSFEGLMIHLYVVWDTSNGLSEGKSVRYFVNGKEYLSTTANLSSSGPFYMLLLAGDSRGGKYIYRAIPHVSNLKVWNHVVTEDPSWEYNNGAGREDALHYIYGESNNYKPSLVSPNGGVGYYIKN